MGRLCGIQDRLPNPRVPWHQQGILKSWLGNSCGSCISNSNMFRMFQWRMVVVEYVDPTKVSCCRCCGHRRRREVTTAPHLERTHPANESTSKGTWANESVVSTAELWMQLEGELEQGSLDSWAFEIMAGRKDRQVGRVSISAIFRWHSMIQWWKLGLARLSSYSPGN